MLKKIEEFLGLEKKAKEKCFCKSPTWDVTCEHDVAKNRLRDEARSMARPMAEALTEAITSLDYYSGQHDLGERERGLFKSIRENIQSILNGEETP